MAPRPGPHKGKVVSQRDGKRFPRHLSSVQGAIVRPASAAILLATLPIPNRPPYAFTEPEVINREIISSVLYYVGFINGQKERLNPLAREAVSFFDFSTFRRVHRD